MVPEEAGIVAGRLWGYEHRRSYIEQRSVTPAANEALVRVYGPATSQLTIQERTAFTAAFRSGILFWGARLESAPVRCSRCQQLASAPAHKPGTAGSHGFILPTGETAP